MTLQINVNLPPRLIERAREQQSERRLAAVASQRRAVVRQEAARQLTVQRALAGKDAQGKDLRAGAVADDRRKRPVLAHQTKQYQVGFLQEVYIGGNGLEVRLLSGKTIIKWDEDYTNNGAILGAVLPVDKRLILFCYVSYEYIGNDSFGNDSYSSSRSWYLCNENSFKKIGVKSDTWLDVMWSVEDAYEANWGFGAVSYYGQSQPYVQFLPFAYTPGALYKFNGLQPDQWAVKPNISILQRIESISDYDQEYLDVDFYISRETQGKYGLPEWWWLLNPEADYLDFEIQPDWPVANYNVKKSPRMSLKTFSKHSSGFYIKNNLVWDWGQPSLCRELLYSLGFTESELIL
jgi:hypothetical protein